MSYAPTCIGLVLVDLLVSDIICITWSNKYHINQYIILKLNSLLMTRPDKNGCIFPFDNRPM